MNNGIEFTGERVVPGKTPTYLAWAHAARYRWIRDRVRGCVVLDAGCGEGYGVAYLSQSAAHAVGVDLSFAAVRHAQAGYGAPALSFAAMECSALGFAPETFDVVCSFEVIEHLIEIDRFVAEIHRVLKPGGTFYVSTPNAGLNMNAGVNPFHEKEFTLAEYEALLAAHFPAVEIYGQVCNHPLREKVFMVSTNLYMRSQTYNRVINGLAPLYFKGQEGRPSYDPNWVEREDQGAFRFDLDAVDQATYFLAVCRKAGGPDR